MVPRFAVVGHPNKGKSSIVATLAEKDDIAISDTPGTTTRSAGFQFTVDGQALYELVDTPGFQRAGAVLRWLENNSDGAHSRADAVRAFVDRHLDDPAFRDECELLTPLLEGAGILYVVDGTKPYGREYELEMQILQWTGRPRMALINLIGDGDFLDEWRNALDQYFSLVRVFDAMHADFETRIALLESFAQLEEDWRGALQQAVVVMREARQQRVRGSASEIASLLTDAVSLQLSRTLDDDASTDEPRQRLEAAWRERVRKRELEARRRVEGLYRHHHLQGATELGDALHADLFEADTWEMFGLSRRELITAAAISGAVAGSGLDLLVGGSSLMLGAGVGALLGSAGAWLGSNELAKVKVLGRTLAGRVLKVGPAKDLNFPWVLLGRAWLHHRLVSERNHARREALSLDAAQASHQVEAIPAELRKSLSRCFGQLQQNPESNGSVEPELRPLLERVLTTDQDSEALERASGSGSHGTSGATTSL